MEHIHIPLSFIRAALKLSHISHNLKHELKEVIFTSNHGRVSEQIRIYSFEVATTIFLYFVYWSPAEFFNKNFTFCIRPAFNFKKTSAQEIFRINLIDAAKYEETRPLKSVRENKVYTICNHTLESITCDENGAYASSKQNKRTFHAEISNHSTATVRTWHKENGIFHYNEKTGQGYTKCPVEEEDVFELEKCYRWNKTFSQLKSTIYRIKNVSKSDYEPYLCVIYSINSDSYSKTVHDREVRERGNSKQNWPYHRTQSTILKRQDTILSANKPPQEVYNLLLDESGGQCNPIRCHKNHKI